MTDFLCDFVIPMLMTIGIVMAAVAVICGSIGDDENF